MNKSFDQVLQFAAIRTDDDLNELERHEMLIRLNPDVIPSPDAVITHRLSFSDMLSGMSEFEAISKIHQIMNQPDTISVGYNTLGFDDEFLRFSFYRNLLPPYTHQWANGCGRMDIYPIAVMYFLFKIDVIKCPEKDGKPTLKLEYLNQENHLADGNAHNAMVDVEAVLELTKRFMKEKEMWEYLKGYFNKAEDSARMLKLSSAFSTNNDSIKQSVMIAGSFGADNFYQCPVLSLGQHNHYKNQSLWLRLDFPELMQTTPDKIPETTYVIRKKLGEPPLLLPAVKRFAKYLSEERLALVKENKKWLQNNEKLFSEIIDYYREYKYPVVPNVDIDAALYQNGFLSNKEQMLCQKFHNASLDEKINLIDCFENSGLREQAVRVLGRNYRDALLKKYAEEFEDYLKHIAAVDEKYSALVDYRNEKRLTPKAALSGIAKLKAEKDNNLDQEQLDLLNELEHYLEMNFL